MMGHLWHFTEFNVRWWMRTELLYVRSFHELSGLNLKSDIVCRRPWQLFPHNPFPCFVVDALVGEMWVCLFLWLVLWLLQGI